MEVRLRDHIKARVLEGEVSEITLLVPSSSVPDLIELLEALLNATRFIRRSTRTTFALSNKLKNMEKA